MSRAISFLALLSAGLFAFVGPAHADAPPAYIGPDHVQVDLLRPGDDDFERTRIFVQALFPDGSKGLFLVDTGAAISVLSEDVAERLNLPLEKDWGAVEGLGGRSSFDRGIIENVGLGDAIMSNVEFAVGVNGVPKYAGWMPLDGILGNNVWGQFVMEVDYSADLLVLHRPDTLRISRKARPMRVHSGHVFTEIGIYTDTSPVRSGSMIIQLDTGASGLMLSGPTGFPFPIDESVYSEGLEPVYGIGAADTVPPSAFLRKTRRVLLSRLDLGAKKLKREQLKGLQARWLNYDGNMSVGPQGLVGLAGHHLFDGQVAIFDYPGERFLLTKSRRKPRKMDGHQVLLEQDLAKHGDDPTRGFFRAKMRASQEEYAEADALLTAFLDSSVDAEEKAEARVLLAAMRRLNSDLDGAWKAIEPLTQTELVAEGEIIAVVNGLLLEGKLDEGLELSRKAESDYAAIDGTDDYEVLKHGQALVAIADALVAQEKYEEANLMLLNAAKRIENPDAQLLRRARIALASGDRFGALAHVRRLLQLYPSNGQYLWFYATLLDSDADKSTFEADMSEAISRLHNSDRPLDYMVHAQFLLGNTDLSVELMKEGVERDCSRATDEPSKDNCIAWYSAMAHADLDESLKRITSAIAAEGERSDFLDTKAMVHLARKEYAKAADAALAAARLSPDEAYMLWQAERIKDIHTKHR